MAEAEIEVDRDSPNRVDAEIEAPAIRLPCCVSLMGSSERDPCSEHANPVPACEEGQDPLQVTGLARNAQ